MIEAGSGTAPLGVIVTVSEVFVNGTAESSLKLLSTTLKYVPVPALDEPLPELGTRLTVKLSPALVIEASRVKAASRTGALLDERETGVKSFVLSNPRNVSFV